ncbi:MAG: GSCFA domain-containing protein [Xanthobacteraceae bacterium]|nr:GSCFA domain-containing protein [Xanthobacteraceae bacterium]
MLDDRPKEAFEEIKYAKTLEPDDSEVKRLYDAITKRLVHAGNSRLISSRWPEMMQNQDNLKGLFKRLILPEAGPPRALFEKNSKVVTIGSCFAMNISAALGRSGIDAVPFFFGEEVNNTASNLAVFEMLVSNDTQSSFEGADSEFIKSALEFGKHLAASDVLILTLGVSFGFFSKDGHPLLLKNTGGIDRSILSRATNRRLDVPENVRNCIKIFEIARKLNPKLRFVVTVSPVPLARAFGFRSAIHADAISKSTLRLVAHELTEIDSNIVYWPSFEMAKWLAPHIKQGQNGFFGADDESSRHVSLHVIEAITTLFIEHFGPQT